MAVLRMSMGVACFVLMLMAAVIMMMVMRMARMGVLIVMPMFMMAVIMMARVASCLRLQPHRALAQMVYALLYMNMQQESSCSQWCK